MGRSSTWVSSVLNSRADKILKQQRTKERNKVTGKKMCRGQARRQEIGIKVKDRGERQPDCNKGTLVLIHVAPFLPSLTQSHLCRKS